MKPSAYCLFETSLGWCGIAWREQSGRWVVSSLHLPDATANLTEARISRAAGARQASPPPADIVQVIERIRRHFQGELQDFRDVAVDLEGIGLFARRVYEAARQILAGETRTYGEIAQALNLPGSAPAVGQALGRNPIGIIVPCHRVLAAGGRPGGFSAYGGRTTKAKLLAIEGTDFRRPGQLSLISALAVRRD
ncbi:MAG: methylated-DNA--[protein]-cysteine S-methyltransferase [Terriglobia bacterium]